MRVIIAGGRDFKDYETVCKAMSEFAWPVSEVVSGCCKGVDKLGEQWANIRGIHVHHEPADWDAYGKKAGPIRNRIMAKYADALVAIWDGVSVGTKDMIDAARKEGIVVIIYRI